MDTTYLYNTDTDTQAILHEDKLYIGFITHKPTIHSWIEYFADKTSFDSIVDKLYSDGFKMAYNETS